MSPYFVTWESEPVVRLGAHGWAQDGESIRETYGMRSRIISEGEWNELCNSEEPSSVVARWIGLPYQKRLPVVDSPTPNVVEILDDQDGSGFNQPCRFGYLVEHHAVYCHNQWWVDAPRKCRRTWYTGGKTRDEDCPGFERVPKEAPKP